MQGRKATRAATFHLGRWQRLATRSVMNGTALPMSTGDKMHLPCQEAA